MISTFSTEMPGFLHKQASDESSCIDFLYISGLPDSKKRQRNYFLCRLYSLFFLYTEFFRILQLSLLHTQGSELHRLCLQHRHRLHLLLPLHLHPVLSVLHLLPEVRYCRLLSLHHRCLRHLTVLLLQVSVSVYELLRLLHSELHHRYHKLPVHLLLHLQVLRWLLLHKHRYLTEQLLLFQALLSGPLCCLSFPKRSLHRSDRCKLCLLLQRFCSCLLQQLLLL